MTLIATLLFSLAALLGLFLVALGIRFQRSSLKIAIMHALVGVTAFAVLIAEIMNDSSNKYNNTAALLMILTLIGGLMLFALREEKRPPAMIMVAIHGGMALTGLLILFLGFQSA